MLLLSVIDISKTYYKNHRRRTEVLSHISFSLSRGETFGLMGVSGAGKTTLGLIIAGIETPTGGEIRLGEKVIATPRHQLRGCVPMLFQNPERALNPRKTINRSLQDVLWCKGIRRRRRIPLIEHALQMVGLSAEVLGRYPQQLSGGQNQRASLARVILWGPSFIILDEPTSALDVSVQAQILHLLRDLQQRLNIGYLFISHNQAVIDYMSHRRGRLENGRLVEEGD